MASLRAHIKAIAIACKGESAMRTVGRGLIMLALVKHDTTLVVVLSYDGHEIERGVAPSAAAAVGLAITKLARRGDDLRGATQSSGTVTRARRL